MLFQLSKGLEQKVLESVGELLNFRCVVELLERQVVHGHESVVATRLSRDPQANGVNRMVTNSILGVNQVFCLSA